MTDRSVVAVTGASSGIGQATALAFAAAGWNVACGARRLDRLEEVVDRARSTGAVALSEKLDVTAPDSVSSFFEAVLTKFGRLDAVVCNAGTAVPGTIATLDASDILRVVETNLVGSALCAQAAVRHFLSTETPGDVVFVSSDSVEKPFPSMVPYVASKAGLEHLAVGLRAELIGTGIRVSTVRLGPTLTEFGTDWDMDAAAELMRMWKRHAVMPSQAVLDVEAPALAIVGIVSAPRGTEYRLVSIGPTTVDEAEEPGRGEA